MAGVIYLEGKCCVVKNPKVTAPRTCYGSLSGILNALVLSLDRIAGPLYLWIASAPQPSVVSHGHIQDPRRTAARTKMKKGSVYDRYAALRSSIFSSPGSPGTSLPAATSLLAWVVLVVAMLAGAPWRGGRRGSRRGLSLPPLRFDPGCCRSCCV